MLWRKIENMQILQRQVADIQATSSWVPCWPGLGFFDPCGLWRPCVAQHHQVHSWLAENMVQELIPGASTHIVTEQRRLSPVELPSSPSQAELILEDALSYVAYVGIAANYALAWPLCSKSMDLRALLWARCSTSKT